MTTEASKTGHRMLKFKLLRTELEVLCLGLGFQLWSLTYHTSPLGRSLGM